jgi:hypothetical protein
MNFYQKWKAKRRWKKAFNQEWGDTSLTNDMTESATGRVMNMKPVYEKLIKRLEENKTK